MTPPSLETYAQLIRQCMGDELDARLRMGRLFIEAKDNYPGEFVAWCRREFPMIKNHGTITNYMALARLHDTRPDLMENGFDLSVMYQLGKAEGSIVTLVEMADRQGIDINPDLVSQIRNTPDYLRELYTRENGRVEVMLKAADSLADAPLEVADLCKRHDVPIAETVQFMAQKYQLFKDGKSESYFEIAESGQLNGIGWSVPLNKAVSTDLAHYNKDRSEIHRRENTPAYAIYRCAADVTDQGLNINMPDDLFEELKGKAVLVIIRYEIGERK